MNLVFEGVNGSGKTTVIEALKRNLDIKGKEYVHISDLTYETPLTSVLDYMFQKGVFLTLKENYKTSLFESLILAANHHYIQEQLRDSNCINIYDRDYISILASQKAIIQKEYDRWEEFYSLFKQVLLFELKKIDLLVYVSIPVEENIRRTEQRDGRKFSSEEIELLYKIRNYMEEEIALLSNTETDVICLNGLERPENNINIINNKILSYGGKRK